MTKTGKRTKEQAIYVHLQSLQTLPMFTVSFENEKKEKKRKIKVKEKELKSKVSLFIS